MCSNKELALKIYVNDTVSSVDWVCCIVVPKAKCVDIFLAKRYGWWCSTPKLAWILSLKEAFIPFFTLAMPSSSSLIRWSKIVNFMLFSMFSIIKYRFTQPTSTRPIPITVSSTRDSYSWLEAFTQRTTFQRMFTHIGRVSIWHNS